MTDPTTSVRDKLEILEILNRYILAIDTHDDAAFADNSTTTGST